MIGDNRIIKNFCVGRMSLGAKHFLCKIFFKSFPRAIRKMGTAIPINRKLKADDRDPLVLKRL